MTWEVGAPSNRSRLYMRNRLSRAPLAMENHVGDLRSAVDIAAK